MEYSGSESDQLPSLVDSLGALVGDLDRGRGGQHIHSIPTLSPDNLDNPERTPPGEWVLNHFSARALMNLASEKLTMEEGERQATLHRAFKDAKVFKVLMMTDNQYLTKPKDNKYTDI